MRKTVEKSCTIENLKRFPTHSHRVRVPEDVDVSKQILNEKYKWLFLLMYLWMLWHQNSHRFWMISTNGWLYLWMQRAPGRLHPALLPQLSSDGAHILFKKLFTLHRSRYKTQNVNNISTKYHPRLISS